MALKALSEKNKFKLLKKLKSHITTIRVLGLVLALTTIFTILAYKFNWISTDFPAYLGLLSLLNAVAVIAYYFQIRNTRQAILTSRKTVITGPIQRKVKHSDEYSTEYSFEVAGNSYDVEAKHFDAFRVGEEIKIELAEPGQELLKVKRVKENHSATEIN